MYFAVLRHTQNRELPPALLETECIKCLQESIPSLGISNWECVFLVQGEKMDLSILEKNVPSQFSFLEN